MRCLGLDRERLARARRDLIALDLIAYDPPLYQVLGLPDVVPVAVRCARLNAERLGVRNADFLCGDAAVPSSGEASLERSGADVAVLDPPLALIHI